MPPKLHNMASNTPRQYELESRVADDRAGPLGPHAAWFALLLILGRLRRLGLPDGQFLVSGIRNRRNREYVATNRKANNNTRPDFMLVGGYDWMQVIYEALKKTNGATPP